MNWLKAFFSALFGILFQDLPYIINRMFRDIDFRMNRVRILNEETDIQLKHKVPEAGIEERE